MLDRDIEDTRQAPEYPEEVITCDFCGDEKEISAIFGKQNCCEGCLQDAIDDERKSFDFYRAEVERLKAELARARGSHGSIRLDESLADIIKGQEE